MDNIIKIPFLNPIKWYRVLRTNTAQFYTKHFDGFMFNERLHYWDQYSESKRLWQTTDTMKGQFMTNFDPIVVVIKNHKGTPISSTIVTMALPNEYDPTFLAYEFSISLAAFETGCYRVEVLLGPEGPTQEVLISDCQCISSIAIPDTILHEYWNTTYHGDVLFETGIKFQARLYSWLGRLDPGRQEERYRDERYNPEVLSSRTNRQWPLIYGDQVGVTDDDVDFINRIWSCNNVWLDQKSFKSADGAKFEFLSFGDRNPRRGLMLKVEEGINRHSSIFSLTLDTNKKIMTTILVDPAIMGDTGNTGDMQNIPVINIQE